jgi:hypothetical protein
MMDQVRLKSCAHQIETETGQRGHWHRLVVTLLVGVSEHSFFTFVTHHFTSPLPRRHELVIRYLFMVVFARTVVIATLLERRAPYTSSFVTTNIASLATHVCGRALGRASVSKLLPITDSRNSDLSISQLFTHPKSDQCCLINNAVFTCPLQA